VVDTRQGIRLREMEADIHADHDHHDHHHAHHEHHDHHDHGGRDPHIWTSPRLLKTQAQTVAATLGELAPEHSDAFRRNLAVLESKLDQLDAAIREKLAGCQGRAMFVFHPAWGYFADEYGLRQVAVELEGKEPTDRELTELQQLARREGIKVVFVQPQISGQSAEAVARAVGARVEVLDPLAEDLPAELLRAAEILAESYGEPRSEPTAARGK
jgi:zinc transport system substrate-binding protein